MIQISSMLPEQLSDALISLSLFNFVIRVSSASSLYKFYFALFLVLKNRGILIAIIIIILNRETRAQQAISKIPITGAHTLKFRFLFSLFSLCLCEKHLIVPRTSLLDDELSARLAER